MSEAAYVNIQIQPTLLVMFIQQYNKESYFKLKNVGKKTNWRKRM